MTQVHVLDASDRDRYEAREGDELIGLLDYRRYDGCVSLDHVEVVPAARGRGIGDLLVGAAVEDARKAGLEIVPVCPFAAAWLKRHEA